MHAVYCYRHTMSRKFLKMKLKNVKLLMDNARPTAIGYPSDGSD